MSETATVTQLPVAQEAAAPARRLAEVRVVNDLIPVLDTARFEHMQRVATVMAGSSLVPMALTHVSAEVDGKKDLVELPMQRIVANCFLVVNQAVRWGMDPFAVAQCVSVVHGKLCYEGKLIAAVISAKLGIDLEYEISGQGDSMGVVVTAAKDGKAILDSKGQPKKVEGTVADWKTTGAGSPWAAKGGSVRMLRYRGAREWCRVHSPALMLGVYSEDEMEVLSDNDRRGYGARDVTYREESAAIAAPRKAPPPPPVAAETAQGEAPDTSAEVAAEITDAPATAPENNPGEAEVLPPEKQKAPPPPLAKVAQEGDGLDIPANLRRAQPPKAAPTIPNASTHPDEFVKWAFDKMNTVKDVDALADVWESEITPRTEGLFPPDQKRLRDKYSDRLERIG